VTISSLMKLQDVNIRSKYRKPTPDEPLWVVLDAGNSDVKAMLYGAYGEEIVFPQMVRKVAGAEYQTLQQTYRYKRAQFEGSSIFESGGQGYVVGQHATGVGSGIQLAGAQKYRRDHLGAILEAVLIQLSPTDHNDVHVVIMHPPGINTENIKDLMDALKGVHRIEVADGRPLVYKVREIIPLEEPVAALQTFLLTQDGHSYKNLPIKLRPGATFLTVDVGGWISVMVRCRMDRSGKIETNLATAIPIQAGIQNVLATLQAELKNAYPVELARLQNIPRQIMNDALIDGETIYIKGVAYGCKAQIDNAMQAIGAPIRQEFTTRFEEGVSDVAIVVSGGGGGTSGDYLKEHVLNHPSIFAAEPDKEYMRFGAIRGASKGLTPWFAQGKANV